MRQEQYYNYKDKTVILFLFICLVILLAYYFGGQEAKVFLFLCLSAGAISLCALRLEDKLMGFILIFAMLLFFAFTLIQVYTGINLPGAGADTVSYEYNGWLYLQKWQQLEVINGETIDAAFYYYSALIGAVYFFFGREPVAAQFMNIMAGLLVVYYIYSMTRLITGSIRASRIAAFVAAVYPTLVIFTAIMLREIYIVLFLVISANYLLTWLKYGRNYEAGISIITLVAAALLHGALIVIGLLHILLLLFVKPVNLKIRVSVKQLIIVILLLVPLVFMIDKYLIYQVPERLLDLFSSDYLRSNLEWRRVGRTHYLDGLVPETYFDLFWQTPIRVFYFLYTPFPWMIKTMADAFVFIDALFYLGLTFMIILWSKKLLRRYGFNTIILGLYIIMIVSIYSWGTVNFGTAWRHRAKAAPLLIVLASAAYTCSGKYRLSLPEDEYPLLDG